MDSVRRMLALSLLVAQAAWAKGGDIDGAVKIIPGPIASRVTGPEQVIVYLEDAPLTGSMPAGPFEMIQLGKDFSPQVLIVPAGATVSFPNQDPILHNVFSVSPGNVFDLGLHKPGDTASAKLEHPGIVAVYCNIHPQMVGYVLVVSNPFFTHPRPDATFRLKGVPPGTYHIVAWFPFGQVSRQEVRVEEASHTTVNLLLRERSDAGRHKRKDGSLYIQY